VQRLLVRRLLQTQTKKTVIQRQTKKQRSKGRIDDQFDPNADPHCEKYGAKRLDTLMCRVCSFYSTGTCLRKNSCANATRANSACL
jgi:hypothetical protein